MHPSLFLSPTYAWEKEGQREPLFPLLTNQLVLGANQRGFFVTLSLEEISIDSNTP
jgi:hypothetical protein